MRAVLHTGDARVVLAGMAAESVHAVVTSPPYWGLRDYKTAGQIGLERTLTEFVAAMVETFAEVHRVLRSDGTLWLNLGDCYNAYNGGAGPGSKLSETQTRERPALASGFGLREKGLKPKDLCLVPARVALALQEWGWYVRSEIVWAKKAPMPESIRDRPTSAHEKVWLLAKSERYYFDMDAVREEAVSAHGSGNGFKRPERLSFDGRGSDEPWEPRQGARDYSVAAERYGEGTSAARRPASGGFYGGGRRNMRNFWLLGPQNFPEAHFATFPEEVPRRAIAAGTSERGCCPACLAPYRRRTEPTPEYARLLGKDWADYEQDAAEGRGHFALTGGNGTSGQRCVKRNAPSVTAAYVTTGWDAGCSCEAGEPIPATVLDCFSGAGTTGVVAGKLGRDYVGIELNPAYVEMSERRILREVGPLLATVEVKR